MPRKSYKPEEIVAKLRQVDVLTSQGKNVAEAVRSIGISEVTYYRWRQEFGGLKSDQVKRLKELETENTRLRRAVSDLTLDKLILQELNTGRISDNAVALQKYQLLLKTDAWRQSDSLPGTSNKIGIQIHFLDGTNFQKQAVQ